MTLTEINKRTNVLTKYPDDTLIPVSQLSRMLGETNYAVLNASRRVNIPIEKAVFDSSTQTHVQNALLAGSFPELIVGFQKGTKNVHKWAEEIDPTVEKFVVKRPNATVIFTREKEIDSTPQS